jgi:hypothetical protein
MATQSSLLQYQQPRRQTNTGPTMSATYSPGSLAGLDSGTYNFATDGSTNRSEYTSGQTWQPQGARPQATMDQQTPGAYGQGAFQDLTNPWAPPTPSPLQNPGNNLVNPGYDEQALLYTQNQLLNDPYAGMTQQLANQAMQPTGGENFLNQQLGSLAGPGQGQQYWQQVAGQFQSPFAGEQFARQATADFGAQGPASAFFNDAMGQYDQFTGYTGPQNSQGQYGQAQQQLGNGTIGQQNMQQLAGQYGNIGQYSDPNLAAGQYQQTQQAFGDLPIAEFDPFFDRARQLGVQAYNQGAAGRGVYGSSEALSGVGNVITDIEAQRALKGFDAEMQRAQEQRARQELLGNQARMGDLSSLAAFASNLAGVETFGNLNNQMGQLQNQSQEILGQMANNADSQALGAQNANISGLNAFGTIANNADTAETDRYEASTNAMNNADANQRQRLTAGADIADMVDDNERADYEAEASAAANAAGATNQRQQTAGQLIDQGSRRDLDRLEAFNDTAQGAEASRQMRQLSQIESVRNMTRDLQDLIGGNINSLMQMDQADFENWFNAEMAPALEARGYDQNAIDGLRKDLGTGLQIYDRVSKAGDDDEKKG